MNRTLLRLVPALSLALVAALFAGCGKDAPTGAAPPRLAPETELTFAPLQGDTAG
jgi:hypothetical protein